MKTRKNPGCGTGASPKKSIAADYLDHNAHAEVLDADALQELDLLVELFDRGYRISVRCKTCGSWLAAPKSVSIHQGPVCRRREGSHA